MRIRKYLLLDITGIIFLILFFTVSIEGSTINNKLSVSHVAGTYPEKYEDFLQYGAKDVYNLGFRGIEVYLSPEICVCNNTHPYGYYQTLDWCEPGKISLKASNLVEFAKHPRYQSLFAMPFKTIFLTTETRFTDIVKAWDIANGDGKRFTPEQLGVLYRDFNELASYLLTTYQNSGKTFIIQTPNEMDWHLISNKGGAQNPNAEPDDFAIQNAIDYWNTIQQAIDDAKKAHSVSGVWIYHGCEFCLVKKGMISGKKCATNSVLPYTHCDLYGYSAYETALTGSINGGTDDYFVRALNYIAMYAPDSKTFGDKNIYISELGAPEREFSDFLQRITARINQALNWGVRFFNYWEIYDNGCSVFPATSENQCRGFWLRKPSGNLSSVYTNVYTTYPSVNNATYVSQDVQMYMIPGNSYPVSIIMKNIGDKAWITLDGYRLGSQNPQDNLRWGIGRILLSGSEIIFPNETKTFNFTVKAPSTPGTYNFQWRMVQEDVEWFGALTPNLNIVVDSSPSTTPAVVDEGLITTKPDQLYASWTSSDPESDIAEYQYRILQDSTSGAVIRDWTSTGAANYVTSGSLPLIKNKLYYFAVKAKNKAGLWSSIGYSDGIKPIYTSNAQFISQSVTTTMNKGGTYTVSVTMKNTGQSIWTKQTLFKLGSQNPRDNLIWGIGRVGLSSPDSIAPGQSKTFTFTVKAPANSGTYSFQWRMLQEFVEWFGNYTVNVQISVQ